MCLPSHNQLIIELKGRRKEHDHYFILISFYTFPKLISFRNQKNFEVCSQLLTVPLHEPLLGEKSGRGRVHFFLSEMFFMSKLIFGFCCSGTELKQNRLKASISFSSSSMSPFSRSMSFGSKILSVRRKTKLA